MLLRLWLRRSKGTPLGHTFTISSQLNKSWLKPDQFFFNCPAINGGAIHIAGTRL